MRKYFATCENCKRRKLFISKRTLKIKGVNMPITSKIHMCGSCFRALKGLNL